MALDSRDKRASAIGSVYPQPDGDLTTEADRIHMAGLYRGILTEVVEADITYTQTTADVDYTHPLDQAQVFFELSDGTFLELSDGSYLIIGGVNAVYSHTITKTIAHTVN